MRTGFVLVITFLYLLYTVPAIAAGKTFGIVAKSINDANFVSAWIGCNTAAKADQNTCILIGAKGSSHPRTQVIALEEAVKKYNFDALAISVTKSDHVARALTEISVPVISFDSPFEYNFSSFSKSYVGPDNLNVGKDLARIVKHWYPNGGTICLMTAAHDSNLDLRLAGVRQELSGDDLYSANKKLDGRNGWYECSRSPWNTGDNIARTMEEIKYIIGVEKPDVFIAIGHWPLIDEDMYRETVKDYINNLTNGKTKVLITLGDNLSKARIKHLMSDHLLHGYVKIDFYDMGTKTYQIMRDLADGQAIPKNTSTETQIEYLKD